MEKNLVVGLGEVGKSIYNLFSEHVLTVGFDKDENCMDKEEFEKFKNINCSFLHITIPYSNFFIKSVINLNKKFSPRVIVIHSTVKPNTTDDLQLKLNKLMGNIAVPVIYSPIRGVYKRDKKEMQAHKNGLIYDLKRYTKFFAVSKNYEGEGIEALTEYKKLISKCGVKTKQLSNVVTLELAKVICDTTYYGWLITYAQISNMIAGEYGVDYDEMWSFVEQTHEYLGNRPKMYPGVIGGHCIIPNLELIDNEILNLIKKINDEYREKNSKKDD